MAYLAADEHGVNSSFWFILYQNSVKLHSKPIKRESWQHFTPHCDAMCFELCVY